jgi:hypothetical protein
VTWIEAACLIPAALILAWTVVDTVRARQHSRDVCALFDRVHAQGGEWTAEDHAEMDRLYPREKR